MTKFSNWLFSLTHAVGSPDGQYQKADMRIAFDGGRESMRKEILAMVNSCLVADESLKKLSAAIDEME